MENKQQTALQQAIDYLQERHEFLLDGGSPTTQSAIDEIDNCIAFLESKLGLEKQQIEEAWEKGNNNIPIFETYSISSEDYYRKTYGE